MAKIEQLSELIERHRRKISDADRRVEMLRAELRGLELARDAMMGGVSAGSAPKRSPRQFGRAISETWLHVFDYMSSQPGRSATTDELMQFIEREGLPIKRNTLRSQLSIYSSRGVLERIGPGRYRTTESGLSQLGIVQNAEGSDVAASEPSIDDQGGHDGLFGSTSGPSPAQLGE